MQKAWYYIVTVTLNKQTNSIISRMEEILIELTNPLHSYFAGHVVDGRVIININEPIELKDVSIILQGTGKVDWNEERQYGSSYSDGTNIRTFRFTYDVAYKAQETYVSQKICLAGDGSNTFVLAAGKSIFPFQFLLPRNCPSSFWKLCSGGVSYSLETKVTARSRWFQEVNVPISVIGIVDLNAKMEFSEPQQLEKVKGSNFLVCRKGSIQVILKLARLGFVPGEILDFSCEITNNSNKNLKQIKAYLIQVAQFHGIYKGTSKKTKMKTVIVSMVKGPEIEAGDYELWAPNCIRIPPVPPSSLIEGIVNIKYSIQIKVQVSDVSGWANPMLMELPVIIGTIPLQSTFDTLRNQKQEMVQVSQIPLPEIALSRPDYPDLPPPVTIKDCDGKGWYGYVADPNYMTYCYKPPNELSENSFCLPLDELRLVNSNQDTIIISTNSRQRVSVLKNI